MEVKSLKSDEVGWQAEEIGKSCSLSPKTVNWQNSFLLRGEVSLCFMKTFN